MDSDQMLIMGGICFVVFLAGYKMLAIGMFVIMMFAMGIGEMKKPKKAPAPAGITVHGAEMLEPIVIESTRGAPFRIPDYMRIRIRPDWGAETKFEKASGKFLGAFARWNYRMMRAEDYED